MKTNSKKKTIIKYAQAFLFSSLLINWGCEQDLDKEQVEPIETAVQLPEFKGTLVTENAGARTEMLNEYFQKFELYSLETESLSSFVNARRNASFKLNLSELYQWEITLEPSDIISDNYKLLVYTESGVIEGEKPKSVYYKGMTSNGGKVRLKLDGNKIRGFIQDGEEDIYIENASQFRVGSSQKDIIVYKSSDVIEKGGTCLAAKVKEFTSKHDIEGKRSASCKREMELAAMTTYRRYKEENGSSVSEARDDVLDIINDVKGNYDDFGIDIKVVTNRVITCKSCTPFVDEGFNRETLDNFAEFAQTFPEEHDAGILFMHDKNSGTIGLAYFGDLICNSRFKYGWVAHFGVGSKHRQVVSHELGHIFGADHIPRNGIFAKKYIMNPSMPTIATNRWHSKTKRIINANKKKDCLCENQ